MHIKDYFGCTVVIGKWWRKNESSITNQRATVQIQGHDGCWIRMMLVCKLESSLEFETWRARRDKRKADHSRLVDGHFNKQGNLHTRSC